MGILALVFCLFAIVDGLGNVEVQLKSLTNSLGVHSTGIYMEIFLGYGTNSGVNISRIVTTEVFQKSNDVRFNTSSGHFNNPFKLQFAEFKNSLNLVFRVLDAGTGSTTATSQQLDTVGQVVGQGEPHAFFSNSPFIDKELNGTSINVKFSYRLQCAVHYYGESCDKICRPKLGQYNCSQYGDKVCEPGWIPPACEKMQPTNPCYNNTCQHNSTCLPQSKPKDGITCACGPSFTGEHCETQLTTIAATTVLPNKDGRNQTYGIKPNATEMEKRSFLDDVTKEDIFIAGCTVAGLLLLLVVLLTSIFCCFYKKRKVEDVQKAAERRHRS